MWCAQRLEGVISLYLVQRCNQGFLQLRGLRHGGHGGAHAREVHRAADKERHLVPAHLKLGLLSQMGHAVSSSLT